MLPAATLANRDGSRQSALTVSALDRAREQLEQGRGLASWF
jgi:hypothetical protein